MNVLDKIEKLRLTVVGRYIVLRKKLVLLISVFITGIIEILCRPLKQ